MVYWRRFSGAYPDGVPGSLSYAYSPRIVTFTSDGSNTRDGFEITLRREAESGTTAAPVEQLGKYFSHNVFRFQMISQTVPFQSVGGLLM